MGENSVVYTELSLASTGDENCVWNRYELHRHRHGEQVTNLEVVYLIDSDRCNTIFHPTAGCKGRVALSVVLFKGAEEEAPSLTLFMIVEHFVCPKCLRTTQEHPRIIDNTAAKFRVSLMDRWSH